jgi:hypothetical protein
MVGLLTNSMEILRRNLLLKKLDAVRSGEAES